MLEDVKNENQVLKQSVSSTPVETASETFPSTLVKVDISREIFEMTLSIYHPN